ncbi:putative pentatricopeptide repeat-containing protein At1g12700, mitochondrial isoform X3 [Cajanus cajan]|uniref:putative pentatricopeptide repeat-containing protein At1g12700, mitochondrial isoform X3 n=1 Tax=Cajanus cajan TaxID=3821 RepID=UPI00098DB501|nr:putative pentatricopeptide repeat-containing protein At1g12700, mitochondrial isoform X3 [Cajanus cajan]
MLRRIPSLSRFRLLHPNDTFSHSLFKFCHCSTVPTANSDDSEKHTHFLISMRSLCRSGKVKNLDEALDLFSGMTKMKPLPSVKDFTLLLGVIVRLKHYTTAMSLVKHMFSSLGIEADTITLNIVINCLCHLKLIAFGFSVLGTMFKLGLEPTVMTLTTLINGLCVQGNVAQAVRLADHMEKMGYPLDVYSYGVLINGLCKMGDTSMAVGWLRKIEERNWKPNVVVYSTIIDSLCKDGLVSEALNLFSEMSGKGVQPNLVTYTCLIQGLCNLGRWKEASFLLDEMVKTGMMPDLQTLNVLVDAFCKEGKLMQAKSNLDLNIVSYSILLDGMCGAGKLNAAWELFSSLPAKDWNHFMHSISYILRTREDLLSAMTGKRHTLS